jgi:hypothetical protein
LTNGVCPAVVVDESEHPRRRAGHTPFVNADAVNTV